MIEQAYVQVGDGPTPALKDIRDRIVGALGAAKRSTGLEYLKCWLQMPVDSTFESMMDSDCQERAKRIGPLLSPGAGGFFTPADLGSVLDPSRTWAGIDRALKAGRAVYVNGPAGHVGGARSVFTAGFHVVVFLAVGRDTDGRVYYLGLDPDTGATAESRAAWKRQVAGQAQVAGTPERKPGEFTTAQGLEAVKSMILGPGENGFGPLVRKYYVDTTKKFPPINRIDRGV